MDDDMTLIELFTRTSKMLHDVRSGLLQPHGVVPGHDLVLGELWREDGLTPRQLGERLGISGPEVLRLAHRMEHGGTVVCRRDDPHGRHARIFLTERGRKLQVPVEHDFAELHRRALAGFDRAERAEFADLLERVLTNLEYVATDPEDEGPLRPPSRYRTRPHAGR